MSTAPAGLPLRVLIFAPLGRDGLLTREILERSRIRGDVCTSIQELCAALDAGAGAILLTEEALDDRALPQLITALQSQPPWSDIGVLLFGGDRQSHSSLRTVRAMDVLPNVTLLDRPIRIAAVISAVRSALRSRERQYEVRELLVALHRARGEAEAANRLKDEFLATLSHELRTPLNAILGWSSMLLSGRVPAEDVEHGLAVIDRNAQAQAQLIGDVLDVSRIITGKLKLEPQLVDAAQVMEMAIEAVTPAASARNLRFRLDTQFAPVRADADRLRQVYWNLLSNAVKFSPPGAEVRIAVRPDGDQAVISVEDEGVGIAPEFAPHVFDRFRQADQSMTRKYGGLGLGLAIVKHLVELHGGEVAVASEGEGRGARFTIGLPLATAPAGIELAPDPQAVPWQDFSLGGRSILVVDDDDSTREVVAAVLASSGADVDTASSAPDARDLLSEFTPDLIVADLGMPEEDGFTFLATVRSDLGLDVPVLALSAYADEETRDRAARAGFDAFLAKPTRPHALLAQIQTLLAGRATSNGG